MEHWPSFPVLAPLASSTNPSSPKLLPRNSFTFQYFCPPRLPYPTANAASFIGDSRGASPI